VVGDEAGSARVEAAFAAAHAASMRLVRTACLVVLGIANAATVALSTQSGSRAIEDRVGYFAMALVSFLLVPLVRARVAWWSSTSLPPWARR
jgi:hypothetical protein